jgi:hypothetical protein
MVHCTKRALLASLLVMLLTTAVHLGPAVHQAALADVATVAPTDDLVPDELIADEPAVAETATEIPAIEEPTATIEPAVTSAPEPTQAPVLTPEPTAPEEPSATTLPTATDQPVPTQEPTEITEPITPEATSTAVSKVTAEPTTSGSPAATAKSIDAEQTVETLTIFKVDEQGQPLTDNHVGACFAVDLPGPDIPDCDRDDGANDGTIVLGLPPGTYLLEEQHAPDGYSGINPQQITVVAGGPNEITVANTPLPELTILKVDEQGLPLTDGDRGACFRLEVTGDICDSDDGVNDGSITIKVAPGEHFLQEAHAPKGFASGPRQQVTVVAGEQNEVTVVNLPISEKVTVHTVEELGQPLTDDQAGACFYLSGKNSSWQFYACDSDDGASDGTVVLPAPPGDGQLSQSRGLDGYFMAEPLEVTIVAGGPNEITVVNKRQYVLTVFVVDQFGRRVTGRSPFGLPLGACFIVQTSWSDDPRGPSVNSDSACDDYEDGDDLDGIVRLLAPAQEVRLVEDRTPSGYYGSEPQLVTVHPTGQNVVFVVNIGPAPLTIHLVDEDGEPLTDDQGGACFKVSNPSDFEGAHFACDGEDGTNDGTISFVVFPGTVTIEQNRAPTGYEWAPSQTVEMPFTGATEITVINFPYEELTIFTVDEAGQPITDDEFGACFDVSPSDTLSLGCDSDDGVNDGTITVLAARGDVRISEYRAPDGYIAGAVQSFTVVPGGPNEITVTNSLENGESSPTPTSTPSPTPTSDPVTEPPRAPSLTPTSAPTQTPASDPGVGTQTAIDVGDTAGPSATPVSGVTSLPSTGAGRNIRTSSGVLGFLAGMFALLVIATWRRLTLRR